SRLLLLRRQDLRGRPSRSALRGAAERAHAAIPERGSGGAMNLAETAVSRGRNGGRPTTLARERFERIYRILRNRICLLEYPPGARLSEEELAEEFRISRTPVRRVLARLESEGL